MPLITLDHDMVSRIEKSGHLPTLPSAAVEYMRHSDTVTLSNQQAARLIETDPTLTAKVLAVANSPYYGYVKRISTVELAVAVLGAQRLKEIVANVIMQALLVNVPADVLDMKAFWRYSLFCGVAARYLAKKLHYRITSEAFVAALLHDIGILISAHCFPEDVRSVNDWMRQEHCSRTEAEQHILGATHNQIGAWLTARWNMPEQLVHAIRFHGIESSPAHHGSIPNANGKNTLQSNCELTHLVELTELFALCCGYMDWNENSTNEQHLIAAEKALRELPNISANSDEEVRALLHELQEEYTLASSMMLY